MSVAATGETVDTEPGDSAVAGSEPETSGPAGSDPDSSDPSSSDPDGSEPEVSLPESPEYDLTSAASCELSAGVAVTFQGEDVLCLELRLAQVIVGPAPFDIDDLFEEDTELAVRQFQAANDLVIDGLVGQETATVLGIWPG